MHNNALNTFFVSSSKEKQRPPSLDRQINKRREMYNISELTEYPNVTINVKVDDLLIVLDEAIKRAKEEFSPKDEETYLTTDKTADILGVDRSTLWRWKKSGYLIPIEVGGRRKYKESDIKRILGEG